MIAYLDEIMLCETNMQLVMQLYTGKHWTSIEFTGIRTHIYMEGLFIQREIFTLRYYIVIEIIMP